MPSLLEWFVKERCLWHAEPLFDRDPSGHAVFRCPRCMATWPVLSDERPLRDVPDPLPFESAARRARRRVAPAVTARALVSGR